MVSCGACRGATSVSVSRLSLALRNASPSVFRAWLPLRFPVLIPRQAVESKRRCKDQSGWHEMRHEKGLSVEKE